jgi:hypothetical protein
MAADPGQEKRATNTNAANRRLTTALILPLLSRLFAINPWGRPASYLHHLMSIILMNLGAKSKEGAEGKDFCSWKCFLTSLPYSPDKSAIGRKVFHARRKTPGIHGKAG